MLKEFLYALPEITLLIGVINLLFLYILSYDSPKTYSKTARLWLIVSIFFTILFYDKSFSQTYFENNSYTLLFKLLIGFFTYLLLILSSTWFVTENKTGCKFLILLLLATTTSNLLISSTNIISFLLGYTILIYINYRFLDISYDKLPTEASKRYIATSIIILSFLIISFLYIFNLTGGITNYAVLSQIFNSSQNSNSFIIYLSASFMIIPLIYSLGLAPFHVLLEDKIAKSTLPISHYFALIFPLTIWGIFVKLNTVYFSIFSKYLSTSYAIIAILSIILGAIGANARINLHRIYAYGTMFHYGVILLIISFFNHNLDFSAFTYLLMYTLALNGIYTVFYNLKSHGEYQNALTSLSGISQTRPYTTRALLISIFSLLSFPPFAGFIAEFSFIKSFLIEKNYILLSIILFFFLVLAKSYLEIIKTAYFEPKIKNYDTENKTVLILTLLSIILIIAISFNPYSILEKIKDMFDVIYL